MSIKISINFLLDFFFLADFFFVFGRMFRKCFRWIFFSSVRQLFVRPSVVRPCVVRASFRPSSFVRPLSVVRRPSVAVGAFSESQGNHASHA